MTVASMIVDVLVSWTDLKAENLPISYIDKNGNYYLFASSASISYSCVIAKDGGADQTDFETTSKSTATSIG